MAARATPRVTARPKRPMATSWVRKATDHKTEQSKKAHESKSRETRKALETESGANTKGTPQTKSRPPSGSPRQRETCKEVIPSHGPCKLSLPLSLELNFNTKKRAKVRLLENQSMTPNLGS